MNTFSDMLRYLRKRQNLTQEELGNALGVAKSTISMYEQGTRKPSFEMLEAIADYFNISLGNLVGKSDLPTAPTSSPVVSSSALAPDESRLVRLWRRADEYDKSTIMTVLRRYETVEDPAPPVRMIRHYLVPAAAGYASPIEGEEYEQIPLPADAPQDADFCIEISGDSMEPYIRDGERVYVKQGAPLQDFEPGVFFVDGDVYCKQFCPGYGSDLFYLLSANPLRQDANITIKRDSARSCVYFGKVLLGRKLPRPSYR